MGVYVCVYTRVLAWYFCRIWSYDTFSIKNKNFVLQNCSPRKLYCLLGLKSMVVDTLLDRHRRRASQVEGEQVQKHGGMKLLV